MQKLTILLLITLSLASRSTVAATAEIQQNRNLAASLYAGALTDDNWRQSISGQADFVRSYLLVGAMSWTFYRPENQLWSLELEANIARHFGKQDHFEFNLPILTARWEYFPWDEFVDTSVAYGLGPSFATDTPEVEVENDGQSEQLLLFWHLEVELGLPHSNWDTFFRLHHRSSCYGLFAEKGGGNALTWGLRYEF